MPVLLGTAKPDCDYKDPKSIIIVEGREGCQRQAQFKIWIEDTFSGAFKDKSLHACASHAKVLFDGVKAMATEMRRMGEKNLVVKVVDITMSDWELAGARQRLKKEKDRLNLRRGRRN